MEFEDYLKIGLYIIFFVFLCISMWLSAASNSPFMYAAKWGVYRGLSLAMLGASLLIVSLFINKYIHHSAPIRVLTGILGISISVIAPLAIFVLALCSAFNISYFKGMSYYFGILPVFTDVTDEPDYVLHINRLFESTKGATVNENLFSEARAAAGLIDASKWNLKMAELQAAVNVPVQ